MTSKLPPIPAPDLSQMTIHELWCMADLYERLNDTALLFLNQPRFTGLAEKYTNTLWDQHFNGTRDCIAKEMKARTPSHQRERELRAETLIRHLAMSREDFREIAALAIEATQPERLTGEAA